MKKNLEELTIKENDVTLLTVDLSSRAAAFYLDQNQPQIITSEDQSVKLKLIYTNIDGQITSEQAPTKVDDLKVEYYDVRILIDLIP